MIASRERWIHIKDERRLRYVENQLVVHLVTVSVTVRLIETRDQCIIRGRPGWMVEVRWRWADSWLTTVIQVHHTTNCLHPPHGRQLTPYFDITNWSSVMAETVSVLMDTLTSQAEDVPVPSCLIQYRNSELFYCKVCFSLYKLLCKCNAILFHWANWAHCILGWTPGTLQHFLSIPLQRLRMPIYQDRDKNFRLLPVYLLK